MIKRLNVVAFTLLLIATCSVTPANAIFGFSKCEKVTSALDSEQKIGFENWKMFNEHMKVVVKSDLTWSAVSTSLEKLKFVFDSDYKIYTNIERNKECFSAKFLAQNRIDLKESKDDKKLLTKLSSIFDKYTSANLNANAPESFRTYLKDVYPKFYDWKTGKVLK